MFSYANGQCGVEVFLHSITEIAGASNSNGSNNTGNEKI